MICYVFVKWIQEKRKEKQKAERRKRRKNKIYSDDEDADNRHEPIVIHGDHMHHGSDPYYYQN